VFSDSSARSGAWALLAWTSVSGVAVSVDAKGQGGRFESSVERSLRTEVSSTPCLLETIEKLLLVSPAVRITASARHEAVNGCSGCVGAELGVASCSEPDAALVTGSSCNGEGDSDAGVCAGSEDVSSGETDAAP